MATLARELHAARRVQMADKMQALADETKALNSDRLELEEARKGARMGWRGLRLPPSPSVGKARSHGLWGRSGAQEA